MKIRKNTGNIMKRSAALFLTLVMLCAMFPVEVFADLVWYLDESGNLFAVDEPATVTEQPQWYVGEDGLLYPITETVTEYQEATIEDIPESPAEAAAEPEEEPFTYITGTAEDSAVFTAYGRFPEGSEMHVTQCDFDGELMRKAFPAERAEKISEYKAYNVSFTLNGEPYDPGMVPQFTVLPNMQNPLGTLDVAAYSSYVSTVAQNEAGIVLSEGQVAELTAAGEEDSIHYVSETFYNLFDIETEQQGESRLSFWTDLYTPIVIYREGFDFEPVPWVLTADKSVTLSSILETTEIGLGLSDIAEQGIIYLGDPELVKMRVHEFDGDWEITSAQGFTAAQVLKVLFRNGGVLNIELYCEGNEPAPEIESEKETWNDWVEMFANVELTGNWPQDVVTIAKTQLGYTASETDYDYETHKGYTRYGAWYGDEYGDWCAMFCSFCMAFAGVEREVIPFEQSCERWIEQLKVKELYQPAGNGYVPKTGDLIFFDTDWYDEETERIADHVGIVYENEPGQIITIDGNNPNVVEHKFYLHDDVRILGYGEMPSQDNLQISALVLSKGMLGMVHPGTTPTLTVRFYADRASEDPFAQQILKDGESLVYPDINDLYPEGGYELLGYYLEDGTAFEDFETPIEVKENGTLRLNAEFRKIPCIVYHDLDERVIIRAPYEEGYTFAAESPAFYPGPEGINGAWNTKPDGTGTSYGDGATLDPISEDLNVYPQLNYGHYVRFDSQSGTPIRSQFVLPNEKATAPEIPIRYGYTFDGWFREGSDTAFDFNQVITQETQLIARWTPTTANYTVRVWLEKVDHPNRTSAAQATPEDFYFGTSYVKTGTTEGNVSLSLSNPDASDYELKQAKVQNVINTSADCGSFQIYFYDNAAYSYVYAQTLTESDISEVNANGGIKGDGTTVVNLYLRRLVYDFELTDAVSGSAAGQSFTAAKFDGTGNTYNFPLRTGESISNAMARNNITLATNFSTYFNRSLVNDPYQNLMVLQTANNSIYYAITSQNAGSYWHTDAEDFYMTSVLSPKQPVQDYMKATLYYVNYAKGPTIFQRYFWKETLDSALEGKYGTGENDFETKCTNKDPQSWREDFDHWNTYTVGKTDRATDGYALDAQEGFSLYFVQIINESTGQYITKADDGRTIYGEPHVYDPNKGTYTPYYRKNYPARNDVLEIFELRNHYEVHFVTYNEDFVVDNQDMVFEEPLSDLDGRILYGDNQQFIKGVTSYTDDKLVVWVFDGWYDNEAFIGDPYDFSTTEEIMPSHNLQFFAKWVKKPINITYDANIGTIDQEGTVTEETIQQPNGNIPEIHDDAYAPVGMRFYGWTWNGELYYFDEAIFEDVTLVAIYYPDSTPYTVMYNPGEGTAPVPNDQNFYLYNADAKILEAGEDGPIPPEGKYFLCWTDKNNIRYFPGNSIHIDDTVINAEEQAVFLTANYTELPVTWLRYDPGTGTGTKLNDLANTVSNVLVEPNYEDTRIDAIELNASVVLSSGKGFTKDGYVIIGWNSDKEKATAGEVEFELGENCIIDDPEGNVLYAVWKSDPFVLTEVKITKRFEGLPVEKIAELAQTFCITLTNKDTQEIVAKLSLLEEPAEGWIAPDCISEDGKMFIWKVPLPDGEYIVAETGANLPGYFRMTKGLGTIKISTSDVESDVPSIEIDTGYTESSSSSVCGELWDYTAESLEGNGISVTKIEHYRDPVVSDLYYWVATTSENAPSGCYTFCTKTGTDSGKIVLSDGGEYYLYISCQYPDFANNGKYLSKLPSVMPCADFYGLPIEPKYIVVAWLEDEDGNIAKLDNVIVGNEGTSSTFLWQFGGGSEKTIYSNANLSYDKLAGQAALNDQVFYDWGMYGTRVTRQDQGEIQGIKCDADGYYTIWMTPFFVDDVAFPGDESVYAHRGIDEVGVFEITDAKITVSKEVVGEDNEFDFQIQYTDVNGTETANTFTLSNGESKTFYVQAGSDATVTETGTDLYVESYRIVGESEEYTAGCTANVQNITGSKQAIFRNVYMQDIDILNEYLTGYELPKTGGDGVSKYYATGALLMASACIYGIILKRKHERRAA